MDPAWWRVGGSSEWLTWWNSLVVGGGSSKAAGFFGMGDVVAMPLMQWMAHIVAVWIVGIILGWLLPRPRWLQTMKQNAAGGRRVFARGPGAWVISATALWLGRLAVLWNAMLLVREVWYRFCSPGTFRAIMKAMVVSVRQRISFAEAWERVATGGQQWRQRGLGRPQGGGNDVSDTLQWYVSVGDLEFFKDAVDTEKGGAWEKMFEKSWESCSYIAWRRRRPSGRTEYKSVTVARDATAQEFMDFYLDDDVRPKWDGLISHHELLESAHGQKDRCQVVRWLRSFPFAFISDREYVIARRMFTSDKDTLYGITKSIEHPAAPRMKGTVRMDDFYSMWRSRTVPCPDGSGKPACETTLLHFEDFGIPENLARFAVRHGMGGFVQNMVPYMKLFVEERRGRCKPTEVDCMAYGAGLTPLFPRSSSSGYIGFDMEKGTGLSLSRNAAEKSTLERTQSSCSFDDSASESSGHAFKRSKSARNFGYALLASGIAIALSGVVVPKTANENGNENEESKHHRHHPYVHRRGRHHRHRKFNHGHAENSHIFRRVYKIDVHDT